VKLKVTIATYILIHEQTKKGFFYMKKFLITGILLLLMIGAAILAVKRKQAKLANAQIPGDRPIPITIATAHTGTFTKTLDYVGVVEPNYSANIASRVTSEINEVLRVEGDLVKKGELLIKLDDRKLLGDIAVLKAKLEEIKTKITANGVNVKSLEATAAYWKKQVERDQFLSDKNVTPLKELETSTEKYNNTKGLLDVASQNNKTLLAELTAMKGQEAIAQTNLSYAKIVSPFDGVVCERVVDPGDLASPGKLLMVIENQKKLKVVVDVPQTDVRKLHVGQPVRIACRSYEGHAKLSRIYPAVAKSRMVRVESFLPSSTEGKLISGQYVRISMATSTLTDVTLIPDSAVNSDNDGGAEVVYILKNGRLKKRQVKLLGNNGKTVALNGIKAGEQVVVSAFLGWAKLADGLKATPVRELSKKTDSFPGSQVLHTPSN
jgi:RND family efflux transporter MFP subunit